MSVAKKLAICTSVAVLATACSPLRWNSANSPQGTASAQRVFLTEDKCPITPPEFKAAALPIVSIVLALAPILLDKFFNAGAQHLEELADKYTAVWTAAGSKPLFYAEPENIRPESSAKPKPKYHCLAVVRGNFDTAPESGTSEGVAPENGASEGTAPENGASEGVWKNDVLSTLGLKAPPDFYIQFEFEYAPNDQPAMRLKPTFIELGKTKAEQKGRIIEGIARKDVIVEVAFSGITQSQGRVSENRFANAIFVRRDVEEKRVTPGDVKRISKDLADEGSGWLPLPLPSVIKTVAFKETSDTGGNAITVIQETLVPNLLPFTVQVSVTETDDGGKFLRKLAKILSENKDRFAGVIMKIVNDKFGG